VSDKGEISQIMIERGVSLELDNEAKRIVGIMPKWNSAESGGKRIDSQVKVKILFSLPNKD
jgi:hypothetical protein